MKKFVTGIVLGLLVICFSTVAFAHHQGSDNNNAGHNRGDGYHQRNH